MAWCQPARAAGDLDRTVGEVIERARRLSAEKQPAIRGGALPVKVMLELAASFGVSGDPVLRQELASYISQVRINGWTMRRTAAAGGRLTGADGSIAKLTTSRICQDVA